MSVVAVTVRHVGTSRQKTARAKRSSGAKSAMSAGVTPT
jgi:hypothetical protein